TLPLMIAALQICARIGMVSGMGLAAVLRRHYARNLLYLTVIGLVIANTINAGADIGAIAAAINLLVPVPIVALVVPIALTILAGRSGSGRRDQVRPRDSRPAPRGVRRRN